jgi:hypothetical protein
VIWPQHSEWAAVSLSTVPPFPTDIRFKKQNRFSTDMAKNFDEPHRHDDRIVGFDFDCSFPAFRLPVLSILTILQHKQEYLWNPEKFFCFQD